MTPHPLRIVRGHPTAEELAAVVTVLAAATRSPGSPDGARAPSGPPAGRWADRAAYAVRRVPAPGPGAWRASALPR